MLSLSLSLSLCVCVCSCVQVVTEYDDSSLPMVLDALERMEHHLTAAVVSNNIDFVQHVLAHTVNGTTYSGIRARTTGEPWEAWRFLPQTTTHHMPTLVRPLVRLRQWPCGPSMCVHAHPGTHYRWN